jgi:hypothetical protein
MPLDNTPLPYGLRDVKLTAYTDAAGTVLANTSVDLPVSQTFSFSDTEDFEELRGDDRSQAQHGKGASVDWELDSGGLPFEAYQIMAGGTITNSGTTPAQQKIFDKKVTDQRPYFRVEGQVISDSGGDVHCILPRCKATGELSGQFADGAFWITTAKGVAMANPDDGTEDANLLYRFVQNETAVDFVEPNPLP